MSIKINSNVLIVGYGVVGHNLSKELVDLVPDIYDSKYPELDTRKDHYDFAFICVDTPYINEDNPCDLTQVENALKDNSADIYIIKSTILPGTVEKLKEKYKKRIVFSPEYYGGTQHCNNFEFNFTILGGDKKDCLDIQQLLQYVYDGRHTFRIVDSKTAELVKYMENCFLATKVSFCNQFYKLAEKEDINYESLRELFILDPRVNPSHTFVYNNHPYWSSHCLDKDVMALLSKYKEDASLIKSIIDFNNKMKE